MPHYKPVDRVKPPLKLFQKRRNFGDNLNGWIYHHYARKLMPAAHYFCLIGSILETKGHGAYVWGSGYGCGKPRPGFKPRQVCAVRGRHTQQWLRSMGIECPDIYGDPALLLPEMFYPKVKKQYQLGFIPHKRDPRQYGDIVIHPEHHTPMEYIKQLLSCEVIMSSSLHGLVAADAYGIPNAWLWCELEGVPDFKWVDYYSAVGLRINPLRDTGQIRQKALDAAFIKPKPDLELLKSVRPF